MQTWIKISKPGLVLTLFLRLFQFVALQLSRQAKEVEIYFRKNSRDGSFAIEETGTDEAMLDRFHGLERLKEEKSLSELYPSFASGAGDLVILSPLCSLLLSPIAPL
jgi:E3 ubiquitin-protein ligase RNF1/2